MLSVAEPSFRHQASSAAHGDNLIPSAWDSQKPSCLGKYLNWPMEKDKDRNMS